MTVVHIAKQYSKLFAKNVRLLIVQILKSIFCGIEIQKIQKKTPKETSSFLEMIVQAHTSRIISLPMPQTGSKFVMSAMRSIHALEQQKFFTDHCNSHNDLL